jgi:nitrous oxide reductase accessory protein NosL
MPLRSRTTGIALVLMLLFLSTASAADIMCTECGMRVDMTSKFSARITHGDTAFYFCDIGDLFAYLKKNTLKDARIEVKDYASGAWIDARNTFYVHAEKKFSTPMGWGIAAFKNKSEATQFGIATDFDATAKALR